ncbi:MAG: hypothetical protein IJM29_04080 [Bacteroidales bacterium]|nr:hypothetical protein [Bacteroidales bacterium]
MKKIYILISTVAALALTSACNLKTEYPPINETGVISLDLKYSEPGVKSDGVGNENDINSVDYFFYTDTTKAPVYSFRDENPSVDGIVYTISLTAGQDGVPSRSNLFKDGQFELYAVFNAPEEITPADLTTVKQTAVDLSFAYYTEDADGNKTWYVTPDDDPVASHPKYFVMTGQKTIKKASGGEYANVQETVDMKRLVAKVSAKIKILQSKTVSGLTWKPFIGGNNVHLYLCNFVQNSLLSAADETPILPAEYTQADYTNYVLNTSGTPATEGNYYVFESQQDFYTYPIEWTPGSDKEPYLKLVLPWKEDEGTVPNKELYYKIMFPSDITSIEANKFYQLEVAVGLIGNEGDPVVVVPGYNAQVVDWKANSKVSSAVSDAKYLSIEKESVEYYTKTSGISFSASEHVYLEIKNVYQKNLESGNNEYIVKEGVLQNGENGTTNVRSDLGAKSWISDSDGNIIGLKVGEENWIDLSNTDNYLEVGHTLNANLTSEHMDVTPWFYEITMKLVGVDGSDYDRDVVFEQCPNVYVVEDPNRRLNSTGGVYINTRNGNNAEYGGVNGLTGSNTNGSMYVITIAVSDTYMIGDPRGGVNNNLGDYNNNWSREGRWTEGAETNHRLTYYHPASTSNDYSDMIAPKIRIASSYGVTSTISKNDALKRCASYQEDGIPAGRWRLPTKAEVKFICALSTMQRIPILFGQAATRQNDTYSKYWTGYGAIEVNNYRKTVRDNTNNNNAYVRCVYDEWFWGDATETRPVDDNQYYWGDRDYQ